MNLKIATHSCWKEARNPLWMSSESILLSYQFNARLLASKCRMQLVKEGLECLENFSRRFSSCDWKKCVLIKFMNCLSCGGEPSASRDSAQRIPLGSTAHLHSNARAARLQPRLKSGDELCTRHPLGPTAERMRLKNEKEEDKEEGSVCLQAVGHNWRLTSQKLGSNIEKKGAGLKNWRGHGNLINAPWIIFN